MEWFGHMDNRGGLHGALRHLRYLPCCPLAMLLVSVSAAFFSALMSLYGLLWDFYGLYRTFHT